MGDITVEAFTTDFNSLSMRQLTRNRDPLVIFDDAIEVDDTKTTEHFENIQ
eukprot:evm.model.NODE_49519_length_2081_cov_22.001442.1